MATWISKDTSKPYYGKEVTVSSSGKIVAKKDDEKLGVLPSGNVYKISETSLEVQAAHQGAAVVKTSEGKKAIVSQALAKKIETDATKAEKEYQQQKSAYDAAQKAASRPAYTLTARGVAYTDTGELVENVRKQQIRQQAFEYLPPAEKVIAKVAGSRERVFTSYVEPKLRLARQADMFEQERMKVQKQSGWMSGPYVKVRTKELFVSAKAGAFGVVSAPIETTAAVLVTKTLPAGTIGIKEAIAAGVVTSIIRDPQDPVRGLAKTTGEFAVVAPYSMSIDALGGKRIPKWGTEDIKYKTVEPKPQEIKAYKGVTFGQKPLIGKTYTDSGRGKLTIGKPDLKLSGSTVAKLDLKGYVPVTKTEARFAQSIAEQRYGMFESTKSKLAVELISGSEYTRSLESGRLFPKRTKTLSEQGTKATFDWIRKERGLAYGSATADPQLPKGALARGRGADPTKAFVGDIDVQLNVNNAGSAAKASKLAKILSKTDTVRISKQSPTLIEAKVGGQWHHAVDIHSIDQPLDLDIPAEGAWGFKFDARPVKIEGVKSMALSEFRTRKAASILTFREQGFAPEAHRFKDIPDFLTSQEYLTSIAKPADLPKVTALRGLYGVQPSGTATVPIYSPSPSIAPSPVIAPSFLLGKTPSPKIRLSPSPNIPAGSTMPASLKIFKPSPVSVPVSPSIASSFAPSRAISSSISPSRSPSRSVSPSISPSISVSTYSPPSVSRSLGRSPSRSVSPSKSISSSISPSYNVSSGFSLPTPKIKAGGIGLPMGFGSTKWKPVKFKPKYFASVTATTFNIKGKPTKFAIASGLGVRPIAV